MSNLSLCYRNNQEQAEDRQRWREFPTQDQAKEYRPEPEQRQYAGVCDPHREVVVSHVRFGGNVRRQHASTQEQENGPGKQVDVHEEVYLCSATHCPQRPPQKDVHQKLETCEQGQDPIVPQVQRFSAPKVLCQPAKPANDAKAVNYSRQCDDKSKRREFNRHGGDYSTVQVGYFKLCQLQRKVARSCANYSE